MFGSFGRHVGGGPKPVKTRRLHSFEHTHLGVYFVGAFTVACIFVDSCQGFVEKYHVGKKWFYLYGVLCSFAYWYVRPLIRRRLGSAQGGYLNYYAVYIVWLCSAVFYHLPKLEDLGMNMKADLSIMMPTFVGTFLLIVSMHGLHLLAVMYGWISPFLLEPCARSNEMWAAIMINSTTLAVACSTYFSFCGNAVVDQDDLSTSAIKTLVCHRWLQPVNANKYPTFRAWVLYGEIPLNDSINPDNNLTLEAFPAVRTSGSVFRSTEAISPVLMIWLTLLSMYFVNCAADHFAAHELDVTHINELRRTYSDSLLHVVALSQMSKAAASHLGIRSKSLDLKAKKSEDLGVVGPSSTPCERRARRSSVSRPEKAKIHPDFLPMVPWYCGTSADMIKMSFDLTISLKLFLGRFDMRTMQAATSDLWSSGPHEGDGFTFFTFQDRDELWMDFFADTGDGGNSTYTVARALAAPELCVKNDMVPSLGKELRLPRADLLLLGGDLAYPSPSCESYEHRLFAPFQDAMPSPVGQTGQLITLKSSKTKGTAPQSTRPQCFAIPGNHDWHDGLEVFMHYILHRGWLGGWALPQEKSYFALALPHDWWLFAADLALVWDIDICQYRYFAQVIEKHLKPESQVIIMAHEPIWMEDWLTCSPDSTAPNLRDLIRQHLKGRARVFLAGDLHFYMRHSLVHSEELESALPAEMKKPPGSTAVKPQTLDPEHLIIQGTGGAFLHPTHVFSGAKIPGKFMPSPSSGKGMESTDVGEYVCKATYPSTQKSLKLGRYNLSRFRSRNTRFDMVGALWYFLLVWSVFPRCNCIAVILEMPTFTRAITAFVRCFWETLVVIFSKTYISLIALIVLYVGTFLFAIKGSVACATPPASWDDIHLQGEKWLSGFASHLKSGALRGFKARTGGYSMCALVAFVHTLAHLTVAIVLMLILEIGFYTCIKHDIVGKNGYHSLFHWFESFMNEHFPDPMGVRTFFRKYSLGIYPRVVKYFMAIFDIPEVVAVGRTAICNCHGTWESLTRLQTLGYYLGMLAYYWLLASPAMGLVFGLYLYVSCCCFHIHYDEAFSALRIPHHKGFSRIKICSNGDLELFSVAVDRVAQHWVEDPRWRGPGGGGFSKDGSHTARYPSRWIPDRENCPEAHRNDGSMDFKIIDHLVIPKRTVLETQSS